MSSTDVELERYQESEAGKALAAHGFTATHQGGGLVNFEGERDGMPVQIIQDEEGSGWGPLSLDEPVLEIFYRTGDRNDWDERPFPSLRAYLATLA